MEGNFYLVSKDKKTKHKIKNDMYLFYKLLTQIIPNNNTRIFVLDKTSSEFHKDLELFIDILTNEENIILVSKILCMGKTSSACLKNSEIKSLLLEHTSGKIIIRAFLCANIENDMIYLRTICGVGGGGILLENLKKMVTDKQIKVKGIYLHSVKSQETQKFYNKQGFRPKKEFVEQVLDKQEKMKKSLVNIPVHMKYTILGINPILYWFPDKYDETFYPNNDWDKIII